jgi:hypothetical protein
MKFKKNIVAVAVFALLAGLVDLPATRDEADWYWAETRNHADDYLQYFNAWPHGRHTAEAHLRYQTRSRKEATKAMIDEALKKSARAMADPDARQERRQRMDRFLWHQVTNADAIPDYRGYLQRFPSGEFAIPARRRLQELYSQAPSTGATNLPGR